MAFSSLLPLLSLLAPLPEPATGTDADTLKSFHIDEAVVVASPKETKQLRRQPVSVTLFDADALSRRGVKAVNGLSTFAPNFYMPEYGSRLTSAVYIRGIGSRLNTPAVGLYVDNVPYMDKTAYHFHFQDIERVDVLRGPQGTLYGRNTMGGLIRVFTADPIKRQGTTLGAGWTSRTGGRRISGTTYIHPAERMGLSLGAFYEGSNGFRRNSTTGRKQDGEETGGGKLRWSWRPDEVLKIDLTASYEYSREDACPYFYLGETAGYEGQARCRLPESGNVIMQASGLPSVKPEITQNRASTYRRNLFNAGLGVEHRLPHFVLTSITAWQHLDDRLFMDQDFTAEDIFSLEQTQRMHTVSEEVALRSHAGDRRWQWTTGAFGMYQHMRTGCPVTFYADGMDYLNGQLAAVMPERPAVSLRFTDASLPFGSRFVTPAANFALFHQSTVNDLGLKGLSLTLGVRLDYDRRELRLDANTATPVNYRFDMSMGSAMAFGTDLTAQPTLHSRLAAHSVQVLPKGALSYTLPSGMGNAYFSVAKGYRAGGYNIQAYSELCQNALSRDMMLAVKEYSANAIGSLPLPDAAKENALRGMTAVLDRYTPDEPDASTLQYKPEHTWSYEAGAHLNFIDRKLLVDLAAFFMKTRDQQLARFADSGMGRMMVNAGRSRSVGLEASLRALLLDGRLQLGAGYGLTAATFTNYDLGNGTDYTGNRVPFVPRHTLSASADFRQTIHGCSWLHAVSCGADVSGAGSVVWDEANTFSQDFYATAAARFSLEFAHRLRLEIWGRNLTATRYATFSFESLNRRFAQYNTPRHFGADVKWSF